VREKLAQIQSKLKAARDWGLAVRLIDAKRRRILLQLSRVYNVMPISTLLNRVGVQVEHELLSLGEDFNSFSTVSGVSVTFEPGFAKFFPLNVEESMKGLAEELLALEK
jgi:hypothetical protein